MLVTVSPMGIVSLLSEQHNLSLGQQAVLLEHVHMAIAAERVFVDCVFAILRGAIDGQNSATDALGLIRQLLLDAYNRPKDE